MSSIPIPTVGETDRGESLEMSSPKRYNGRMPTAVRAKSVTTQATMVRRSWRLSPTAAFCHFQWTPNWEPYQSAQSRHLGQGTTRRTRCGLAAERPSLREVTDRVFPLAYRLLTEHDLRTLDALHLAVASTSATALAGADSVVLVTRDDRQAAAAAAMGLETA